MTLPLRCTRMVTVIDGYDNQHNRLIHHERCARPAREVEITGLLTMAKAILCEQHEEAARQDALLSRSGYPVKKTRANNPKPKWVNEPFLPFLAQRK